MISIFLSALFSKSHAFMELKFLLLPVVNGMCSGEHGSLLEQMVEVLCRHVSDDSSNVRRLCLRGLVQVVLFTSTHDIL